MKWLNRDRITVYPRIFVALYIIIYCYTIAPGLYGRDHILDRNGTPIGADFSNFYSAAALARTQSPAATYDFTQMRAAQVKTIGANPKSIAGLCWTYPPIFLLLLLPFSFLPYFASLAVWLLATLLGYLKILLRIAPSRQTLWLALAFPGTFQNAIHGQNGFLSACILGGGLLLLESHAFLGGIILGFLSYKPQLAVLIPVALIAGRHWKALAGASLSFLGLVLASLLIMGTGVWLAFWESIPFARKLFESGAFPIFKGGTAFNAALLAGASYEVARDLQAIIMIGAVIAVFFVWSRNTSSPVRNSVLVLSILLFTPHAYPYDFVLLALPIAWMGWQGYTRGWLPLEKPFLLLAWLLPLLIPLIGKVRLQLAPLIVLILIILALQRDKMERVTYYSS
jgi:alpha-1,2-mannosyltransferase